MVKVKICGITSIEDGLAAISAGADFIGLIVEIARSASNLSTEEAKKIAAALHGKVPIVALTELGNAKEIAALCSFLSCGIVQLVGECPKKELVELRRLLPKLKVAKAVPADKSKAFSLVESLSGSVHFFVLDSSVGKQVGGTGKTHDWKRSAGIVKASRLPCFLAGGLNPENVATAAAVVKPFAVDVCSGVKLASNKRKLDIEKTKAFVAAAKAAP